MVHGTWPAFHPRSESGWLMLINMACPVRNRYGSRKGSRNFGVFKNFLFYYHFLKKKWCPWAWPKWRWRCNPEVFAQGPEGQVQSRVLKENGEHVGLGFQTPWNGQISLSLTSCDIWVQSCLPCCGGRSWWLHMIPFLFGIWTELQWGQNFRSLFSAYGAAYFTSGCVWFLSPVSLGLAKKQVWLVIETGSWGPILLVLLLWEKEWRWGGGPSTCGQLSKAGVNFFILPWVQGRKVTAEGHTLHSHSSDEGFGKR